MSQPIAMPESLRERLLWVPAVPPLMVYSGGLGLAVAQVAKLATWSDHRDIAVGATSISANLAATFLVAIITIAMLIDQREHGRGYAIVARVGAMITVVLALCHAVVATTRLPGSAPSTYAMAAWASLVASIMMAAGAWRFAQWWTVRSRMRVAVAAKTAKPGPSSSN